MSEPHVPAKRPISVTLEPGKTYYWCQCGASDDQPFCNGAHQGTEFSPLEYTVDEPKEVWLCQCKHSKNPPLCDGAHKTL